MSSVLLTDVQGSFVALLSPAAFPSRLTEDCIVCILPGPLQPPPHLPFPLLSLELSPYHPLQLPSPSWGSSHSFQAVPFQWMASRPIFAAWPVTQFQHLHWAQSDALLTLNRLLRLSSRPSSVSLPHRLSSLTLPAWLQVPSWVPSLPHLSGCKLSPDSCPPPGPPAPLCLFLDSLPVCSLYDGSPSAVHAASSSRALIPTLSPAA